MAYFAGIVMVLVLALIIFDVYTGVDQDDDAL